MSGPNPDAGQIPFSRPPPDTAASARIPNRSRERPKPLSELAFPRPDAPHPDLLDSHICLLPRQIERMAHALRIAHPRFQADMQSQRQCPRWLRDRPYSSPRADFRRDLSQVGRGRRPAPVMGQARRPRGGGAGRGGDGKADGGGGRLTRAGTGHPAVAAHSAGPAPLP